MTSVKSPSVHRSPARNEYVALWVAWKRVGELTRGRVVVTLEECSRHGWSTRVLGDRWGVTNAETTRRYPCDDLVPDPALQLWRGVTVRAAPDHVWPWVAQIRIAPYSYDLIDNLGRKSPKTLKGLPEPVVGEPFTTALGGRRLGRILAVDSGRALTATIMGTVMSYVLMPVDQGRHTRLLLKITAAGMRTITPLLAVGDLIMARRQLLNLAALAENTVAS